VWSIIVIRISVIVLFIFFFLFFLFFLIVLIFLFILILIFATGEKPVNRAVDWRGGDSGVCRDYQRIANSPTIVSKANLQHLLDTVHSHPTCKVVLWQATCALRVVQNGVPHSRKRRTIPLVVLNAVID
jgi:hypothetical protein